MVHWGSGYPPALSMRGHQFDSGMDRLCGISSVVERDVANVEVVSSNLISRSFSFRGVSSVGLERLFYMQGVVGSSPTRRTE